MEITFCEKIEHDEKVTEFDEKNNRVHLTAKQKKVLEFCDGMPHTAQEILEKVGVKYQTKTVLQYTTKLVLMGLLRPSTTFPNDPNRNTSQRMERNENGEIIVFM